MAEALSLWHAATRGLVVMAVLGLFAWAVCCLRHNVALVDRVWSWFFMAGAAAYALALPALGPRAPWVAGLLLVWGLRLSAHITWRSWGHAEDRRYQAMRQRHSPHFVLKSLGLVFGLQALIAWCVSAPLLAALASPRPLGLLDAAGIALTLFGTVFEAIADWQLLRFQRDASQRGRVMDQGLWRFSRHPNYFGEACVWWGLSLLAFGAGAAWTVFSPLLMTLLLLKVSGVTLLEHGIAQRRPGYADYVRRTNAFVPGPRRPAP
ncbi:DUF1295 domain-containing protein [Ideonella sp. BN130291]|uniref:DUF1295 domain-containing protein n=1 Tax=Ideonella sp. BN130291 TaxID=3112940 RepID=UPI002E253178|nr:DUF1295 domain-containing protein [Ideonella sp. BN130291]